MKLGALKSAIRDLKTAPKALVRFGCDKRSLVLDLQKTPLLAELDKIFIGGRAEETGFEVTADGYLSHKDELTADSETITISLGEYRSLKRLAQLGSGAPADMDDAESPDLAHYDRHGPC
jgi:hypothetical protein